MKKEWIDFLKKAHDTICKLENDGCDSIAFRGQGDSDWDLVPSLILRTKPHMTERIEDKLYFDFVTNAGPLLRSQISSWEILFEMRHHGVPTRILDWTENFGTALYFALNGKAKSPCIWLLDPYKLNKLSYNDESIPNPLRDLPFDYCEAYIDQLAAKRPYVDPIAIIAPRISARLFAQKGLFTLQGTDKTPLNKNPKVKDSVAKLQIPTNCLSEAQFFLKMAGINHYSIFPDLDGLSKHLLNFYGIE